MKILIVGEQGSPHALAGALESAGVEVERPPKGAFGAAHDEEVGELATALIAFEQLLADHAPDAVLLVSGSNLALAAVLVATKLQIPVGALADTAVGADDEPEMNRRLIARLADGTVACDAETIAASLRDLVAT